MNSTKPRWGRAPSCAAVYGSLSKIVWRAGFTACQVLRTWHFVVFPGLRPVPGLRPLQFLGKPGDEGSELGEEVNSGAFSRPYESLDHPYLRGVTAIPAKERGSETHEDPCLTTVTRIISDQVASDPHDDPCLTTVTRIIPDQVASEPHDDPCLTTVTRIIVGRGASKLHEDR